MSAQKPNVEDYLVFDSEVSRQYHGVVFKVVAVHRVNITVEPVTGGARMRANPALFLPAPADMVAAARKAPVTTLLHRGEVVTVAGRTWDRPEGELYVVLKQRPDETVSIVKLGGDDGRRWHVPRGWLTEVEPPRLVVASDMATLEPPFFYETGMVVTVAGPGWRQPSGHLYAVVDGKGDYVSIVKLGGDGGRYWPKLPRDFLTPIDPDHITLAPTD